MKINLLNLAIYSFLFLTLTTGFFSLVENGNLKSKNNNLEKDLTSVSNDIKSYKSENERLELKLKHLLALESTHLSFIDSKKLKLSELSQQIVHDNKNDKLAKELQVARQKVLSLESGEKPDYTILPNQKPNKMSARRKYFLTHGMYPEQHKQHLANKETNWQNYQQKKRDTAAQKRQMMMDMREQNVRALQAQAQIQRNNYDRDALHSAQRDATEARRNTDDIKRELRIP